MSSRKLKLSFVWVVNAVLVCWILVHAIPRFDVETHIYPPTAILPDGGKYLGTLSDGKFEGDGTLVWTNGNRYVGEFKSGLIDGQGEFFFANGDIYQGGFSRGMMHGAGELKSVSGETYRGDFADGYVHGAGRLDYRNKTYYEGHFSLGHFHGEGIMHYDNGQVFVGTFDNGELVKGQHRDPTGNIYRGEFRDWMYFGDGRLVYASGDVLEGYFEDGALVAHGKHIMQNGVVYEGEFLDSLYHGEGRLDYGDAESYEGAFEYGQFHGKGEEVSVNEDGERVVRKGIWQRGIFQGDGSIPIEPKKRSIGEALYNQVGLLQLAKNNLTIHDPDKIDLYFLGVAGDGSQDVFLREINYITEKLTTLYSLEGRVTRLINHIDTLHDEPLFTLTSLQQTLSSIASVMDVENDILFMYLTSHGSQESGFYVNDKRMNLESLPAERLSAYLDAAGIKWRIIVISACYSGVFIPHLENENTLVITAAREDRQSFGCSNTSEMTYFGKAFFQESLEEGTSFTDAFGKAKDVVERWEDEDQVKEHSEPQIRMGSALAEHIKIWQKQRQSLSP